jgi:two-component system, sensor histidine kinase PdtaS
MSIWDSVRPYLNNEDIEQLKRIAEVLPYMADVSQADVFIDCAVTEDMDQAMVMAEAFPSTAPSLYRNSVVGQAAHAINEPGVMACFRSGRPVLGSRGISQECVAIEQNVIPIRNPEGRTIGTLILERDITENVRQEQRVDLLAETTERLGSTLMEMALSRPVLPSLIQEGMILLDDHGIVTYVNEVAAYVLSKIGVTQSIIGCHSGGFFIGALAEEVLRFGGVRAEEKWVGSAYLKLKAVAFMENGHIVGGMLLIRDQSELMEKEQRLAVQSTVIKEIHHRVKNNLQTISSLLNLQSRRMKDPELRSAFRESMNRINSISVVHDLLARNGLEETDTAELLDRIGKLLVSTLAKPGQSISLIIRSDLLPMSSDHATQLALIVNELIQNSLNHAFADAEDGWIQIDLLVNDGYAELEYSDSGPGFDPKEADLHLGVQIIRTLVRDGLRGEIEYTGCGQECRVSIRFPYTGRDGDGAWADRCGGR